MRRKEDRACLSVFLSDRTLSLCIPFKVIYKVPFISEHTYYFIIQLKVKDTNLSFLLIYQESRFFSVFWSYEENLDTIDHVFRRAPYRNNAYDFVFIFYTFLIFA
jgi:hypothetical protein